MTTEGRIAPTAISSTTTDKALWEGLALVVVGSFCFSLAIPFTRWVEGLNASTITFYRALFGFLFLALLTLRQREAWHFATYRAVFPRLLLLGVMVSATALLYTYSVRHTAAANAALLVNTAPVYVAVLAPLLLGEPRSRYTWLSLALALGGVVMITDPRSLGVTTAELGGVVAGIFSGLGYALVMLLSRSLRGRVNGLTQNLWSNGVVVLVLLPWALRTPAAAVTVNLPSLIPLGVFSLGLSYLLYFAGLARVRAQIVSIASLFEPVFGVLMGMVFFAEVPGLLGWLGGGLILLSVYLISR